MPADIILPNGFPEDRGWKPEKSSFRAFYMLKLYFLFNPCGKVAEICKKYRPAAVFTKYGHTYRPLWHKYFYYQSYNNPA